MRRPASRSVLCLVVLPLLGGCDGAGSPHLPESDGSGAPVPAAGAVRAESWENRVEAVESGGTGFLQYGAVADKQLPPLRPDSVRALSRCGSNLERLELTADEDDAFDEAWADVLPDLPGLRRVMFDGRASASLFATPDGPPLTHLNLPSAGADGADLRAVAEGLPSLELLRLHGPGLTDEDVRVLAALPDLRFLHLIAAPLTNAAVPHLAACKRLESCYLDGALLSADGWAELHRLRPDLHLHADLTHPTGGHADH